MITERDRCELSGHVVDLRRGAAAERALIGEVMRRRRGAAFLASKTKEWTRDGSLRMLEESLKLLQTDHLDLWQLLDIGLMVDGTLLGGSSRAGLP